VVDDQGTIVVANSLAQELLRTFDEHLELRQVTSALSALAGGPLGRAERQLLSGPHPVEGTFELPGERSAVCRVAPLGLAGYPGYRTVVLRESGTEQSMIRELERRAVHDRLTGLPNRELLIDRLEQALRRRRREGGQIGLMFIDLDGFKQINDRFGHLAGDRVLIDVGRRLQHEVRAADTVCRFGGDEFVVLCEGIDEGPLADLSARISRSLSHPHPIEGGLQVVSASIGATLEDDPDANPDDVIARADALMYQHKRRGTALKEVVAERSQQVDPRSAEALRQAIEQRQFYLEYLPVVALSERRITDVEALVRWQHPQLGRRGPEDFLALAEASSLIKSLGELVIDEAARAARTLIDAVGHPLTVFVNLSEAQLADAHLPTIVRRATAERGLDPGAIGFEVAQSVLEKAPGWLGSRIAALGALGCPLVVDDLVTSNGLLDRLTAMGVSGAKLDRPVVARIIYDRDAAATVRATVLRARTLGLKVTAEGVESEVQVTALRELGLRTAQGFAFYGPPQPLSATVELLARAGAE
jgi:diguanylate cyclase (GGDEF)-like protein